MLQGDVSEMIFLMLGKYIYASLFAAGFFLISYSRATSGDSSASMDGAWRKIDTEFTNPPAEFRLVQYCMIFGLPTAFMNMMHTRLKH